MTLATSGATAAVNSTQIVTATLTRHEGQRDQRGRRPLHGDRRQSDDRNQDDGQQRQGDLQLYRHAAGVDTIKAWADINKDSTQNSNDPSATTTITWSTSSLTLVPDQRRPRHSARSQTFTATVKGANNAALANVTVRFTVTGVNPTTGSKTTDSNGQAAFSYTGTHTGVDTITAYADIDNDGAQDNGEPGASTTVTWSGATLTLSPLNVTQRGDDVADLHRHRQEHRG